MAIPSGYRLLTAEDVGKVFGTDLELEVYYDTDVEISNESYFVQGQITNLTNFLQADYTFDDGYETYIRKIHGPNDTIWEISLQWQAINPETISEGLEITSFNTDYDWNTWFYVKDKADPYSITIKNKEGIKLLTKDKTIEFTDDVKITIDESLLGGGGSETKQLTIKWSGGNYSGFYYSVDGEQELTWTTETTLTLSVKSCVILRWGLYVSTRNEETNCVLINGQGDTTYSYLYFLSVTGDNAVLDVTLQSTSGGAD